MFGREGRSGTADDEAPTAVVAAADEVGADDMVEPVAVDADNAVAGSKNGVSKSLTRDVVKGSLCKRTCSSTGPLPRFWRRYIRHVFDVSVDDFSPTGLSWKKGKNGEDEEERWPLRPRPKRGSTGRPAAARTPAQLVLDGTKRMQKHRIRSR